MAGLFGCLGDPDKFVLMKEANKHLEEYQVVSDSFNLLSVGVTGLSFVDLSLYCDERFVISLSGEYYTETRKSSTDKAFIAEQLKLHGWSFVTQMDGIFNLMVFDINDSTVHLFNDWSGNYPLYYYIETKKIYFSSDAKGLYRICKDQTIDKTALVQQFIFGHMLFEHTFMEQIILLKPGSHLRFSQEHGLRVSQYKSLFDNYSVAEGVKHPEDALYTLFSKAVKHYSEHLGICLPLTGGLDSRLLLHLIRENDLQVDYSYTIGLNTEDDRLAKRVSYIAQMKHFSFAWPYEDCKRDFFKNYWIREGFLPPVMYNPTRHAFLGDTTHIIQFPFNNTTYGDRFNPSTRKVFNDSISTEHTIDAVITHFSKIGPQTLYALFTEEYASKIEEIQNEIHDTYKDHVNIHPALALFDDFAWYQHGGRWSNIAGINGQYIGRIAPSQDYELTKYAIQLPYKERYWQRAFKKMIVKHCAELSKVPREGVGLPITSPLVLQQMLQFTKKRFRTNRPNPSQHFFNQIAFDEVNAVLRNAIANDRGIFKKATLMRLLSKYSDHSASVFLLHAIVNTELFYQNFID